MLLTVTSGVVVKKLRSGLTCRKKCPLCKENSEPAKNAEGTMCSNRGLARLSALTNSSGQQKSACVKQMTGEVRYLGLSRLPHVHSDTHMPPHNQANTFYIHNMCNTHRHTQMNILILFFSRKENTNS